VKQNDATSVFEGLVAVIIHLAGTTISFFAIVDKLQK
jgi:hypothetical protein